MNLKAIIAKVVSWFKGEAKAIEQKSISIGSEIAGEGWTLAKDGILKLIPETPIEGLDMSTPAAAPAVTASNVNAAIQIALALKAIDSSLSVDAVQAATNAALAALYPAA
jgi:hypothetical protein